MSGLIGHVHKCEYKEFHDDTSSIYEAGNYGGNGNKPFFSDINTLSPIGILSMINITAENAATHRPHGSGNDNADFATYKTKFSEKASDLTFSGIRSGSSLNDETPFAWKSLYPAFLYASPQNDVF